jgi:hypothetical protein
MTDLNFYTTSDTTAATYLDTTSQQWIDLVNLLKNNSIVPAQTTTTTTSATSTTPSNSGISYTYTTYRIDVETKRKFLAETIPFLIVYVENRRTGDISRMKNKTLYIFLLENLNRFLLNKSNISEEFYDELTNSYNKNKTYRIKIYTIKNKQREIDLELLKEVIEKYDTAVWLPPINGLGQQVASGPGQYGTGITY